MSENKLEGWAILELMGHRTHAGYLREEERFSVIMARIDIPQRGGTTVTKHYGGSSIYGISWVTEEVAKRIALEQTFDPVIPWDLQRPALPAPELPQDDVEDAKQDLDDEETAAFETPRDEGR